VERSFYKSNNEKNLVLYNSDDGKISAGLFVLQGPSGLYRPGGDGSDKIRDPIYFRRETDHRTGQPPI